MTETNVSNSPELISIGEQLRRAREAKGLTIEHIATKLNLTSQVVKALEQDDEAHLPDSVFTRGYVRSYAKLVQLDASVLLAGAKEVAIRENKGIKSVQEMKASRHGSRGRFWLFAFICLAILVGLGYYWWLEQQLKDQTTPQAVLQSVEVDTRDGARQVHHLDEPELLPNTPPAVAPIVTENVDESAEVATPIISQANTEDATTATANTRHTELNQVLTPSANMPPQPTATTNSADEATATPVAAGKVRMAIKFTSMCWFQIKDANGTLLMESVKNAGDEITVEGVAPLNVHLGNAKGQSIFVNNEPFDISSFIKGTTARFKVGQ
ncbi:RodZ family helix-turn-helix domain-containing protein [Pseudomonas sp. F1_0610]|uniref:RodZ domain-containing protein n=1 Tax=Pseudomonas sp. F1_0610 TaxID=3114284 RepID=UPI0039C1A466